MKKTLLTGAGGLVGLQVDADLRIDGKKQLDLRDWEATLNYFEENKPTQVIHCAAKVGGVLANMNHIESSSMIVWL